MGYPHYSGDCADYHDRVIDWGSRRGREGVVKPAGVITLCGSTRFMDEFISEQIRLTLEGFVVITVGLFGHMEHGAYKPGDIDLGTEAEPSETKLMLDNLHFRKIDLANRIHVINKDGYVGTSTKNEVHYAYWAGREITWMEPTDLAEHPWITNHDYSNPNNRECTWFGCGAWDNLRAAR